MEIAVISNRLLWSLNMTTHGQFDDEVLDLIWLDANETTDSTGVETVGKTKAIGQERLPKNIGCEESNLFVILLERNREADEKNQVFL